MKVLVTGGTGYIGRALVQSAAEHGHDVVAFARSASLSDLPAERIDGDIRDAGAVARAARGCDAILHAAALVSIWRKRSEDFDDVNVGGLRNVLAAQSAEGVSRIVYTSSFLALPPSDGAPAGRGNDYQRTKLAADAVARQAAGDGTPIICMYPGVVYGPGSITEGNMVGRLVGDHLRGRLPGLIGADKIWSFAWIGDVAAAHVAALERGRLGTRYPLGGDNQPQRRVFEIVREITGQKLPRRIPFALAQILAAVEEERARAFGGPPLLTRGTLEIFRHDWAVESDAARRELGYRVTPLQDGVRRTVAALRGSPP
jgi:farnesol dehydrogenase